jgi:hypothetical protein
MTLNNDNHEKYKHYNRTIIRNYGQLHILNS